MLSTSSSSSKCVVLLQLVVCWHGSVPVRCPWYRTGLAGCCLYIFFFFFFAGSFVNLYPMPDAFGSFVLGDGLIRGWSASMLWLCCILLAADLRLFLVGLL